MVLQHVYEPLLAVVIMEQRRIKPRGVDIDGVRPRTLDAISSDDVVWSILERAVLAFDIGVH